MIPLYRIINISQLSRQKIFSSTLRRCSDLSIVKSELEVPTFCDVYVDLPCKVRIKPLNIHKYHNFNKFVLQMDQKFESGIECHIDGNKVTLVGNEKLKPHALCSIKAPVKSNLDITTRNDVTVGFFHGDKLKIKSTEGNIFVDRFQGDTIDVSTINGNITLNNYVQASNISAATTNGSIFTGRLQGLNLKLKVIKGDLSVESSYCTESMFVVEKGNMNLNNVHKKCKIYLIKGHVVLTGFDGELFTTVTSGSADIHLSRITGNSEIIVKDSGKLNLKITESCQDFTQFKINCANTILAENIKSEITKDENVVIIKPDNAVDNTVLVNCVNGNVNLESTSWQDMIRIKLKNK